MGLILVGGCGGQSISPGADAGGDAPGTEVGAGAADAPGVDAVADHPDAAATSDAAGPDAQNEAADAALDGGLGAILDATAAPDSSSDVTGPDATGDAMPTDGWTEAFCSGNASRMLLDGVDAGMAVVGRELVLNCCNGGQFEATSWRSQAPVFVTWRERLTGSPSLPATVDLANLPSSWSVRVDVGCDPTNGSCVTPPFGTGLEGSLQVSQGGTGYDMSLCLFVQHSPAGSASAIQSIQLYAPHVATH
jgi:hypothetical protein